MEGKTGYTGRDGAELEGRWEFKPAHGKTGKMEGGKNEIQEQGLKCKSDLGTNQA